MHKNFSKIHSRTIQIYESEALHWDKDRSRSLFEREWLDRFLNLLPSKGSVLDVGCGAGEPITAYVQSKGFFVTGVDTSPTLLKICETRIPSAELLLMDMRKLELNKKFDGIIAWDSFFHLNQSEQREVLPLFLKHLKPQGSMLLTVGPRAGEVLGTVGREQVYHSSLSSDEYKAILSGGGLSTIEIEYEDPKCGLHTVLLATS